MIKGGLRLAAIMLLACMIAACAGGISRQALSQVTYSGPFSRLQQNPGQFQGATVLLGGRIIQTRPARTGSDIVVLQLALDGSDRPQGEDQSQGRFIVTAPRFLDPALYAQGTLITVVGKVVGSRTEPIGQMPYRYPLLELIEIKTWPAQTQPAYPRFHFGIGVGTTF